MRRIKFNADFFSAGNDTTRQFYWAGYFASRAAFDSDDKRKNTITLYDSNEDLVKLKNILSYEGEIRTHSPTCRIIQLTSEKIISDLKLFGIERNKQFTVPTKILHHRYFNHFLRGYVESKSHIVKYLNGKDTIQFRIHGNVAFLNQISKYLSETLDFEVKSKIRSIKGTNSHYFGYTSYDAINKIFNYFYCNKEKDLTFDYMKGISSHVADKAEDLKKFELEVIDC